MAISSRLRLVNPRLGTYFSIFASAFCVLVILALIFERLGTSEALLRAGMFLGPLAMIAVIGLASRTSVSLDYFAAGRRVPAIYCGLGLAATAVGATGLVTMTGALFIVGFDALFLLNGVLAGFVVMAVLLAPFLRKFGTFTVPTYLARRFESRLLRTLSAGAIAIPLLLMLTAEIVIGMRAAAWLTGQPAFLVAGILLGAVAAALMSGGMRALTWTNVAASIVTIFAVTTTPVIVAVMMGYLPFPQLSQGPVLRGVGVREAIQGLPIVVQPSLVMQLVGDGFQPIAKRFSEPFGTIGPAAFVFSTLTVMFGVAASPWLLPRVATTPGVYEARKALGWATVLFGLMILTVASVAIFMRHYLIESVGASIAAPPEWIRALVSQGFAEIATRGTKLVATSIVFDRDSILMALPVAADLPLVFEKLAAVGIIAVAVAGASATALTLANLFAEDVVHGLSWKPPTDRLRLLTARAMIPLVLLAAGVLAVWNTADPFKLLLWALAMNGATLFPVLVASIWWKRINTYGAFASIVTGFGITLLVIIAAETGLTDLSSALAGMISVPASIVAALAVSIVTPPPSKHALELVRDVRIPGGEILYDRELRLTRLKERRRS